MKRLTERGCFIGCAKKLSLNTRTQKLNMEIGNRELTRNSKGTAEDRG